MTPGKKLKAPIIALFAIFAVQSNISYGDECGFGPCPDTMPPCYKVTFSGIMRCNPARDCNDGKCEDNCEGWPWDKDGVYVFENYLGGCQWINGALFLEVDGGGGMLLYHHGLCWFEGFGPHGTGSCDNEFDDTDSCCACGEPPWHCACGYGGFATYEPIWDCSACEVEVCDYNIPTYVKPENYNDVNYLCYNPDCCPVRDFNSYNLTIYTNDSNVAFVVPDCNTSDPCIATVTSYPSTCAAGDSVTFTITPHQALPPAEATVTCTVSFFTVTGDTVSKTVTITVEPEEHDCCACSGGACGGGGGDGGDKGCSGPACGGGGGGPPSPGSPPGPVIGFI